jgi:hypothetical protein
MRSIALLICLAVPMGGCSVVDFVDAPELQGRVVDANTGRAVPGATIRWEQFKSPRSTSNQNGDFHIDRISHLVILPIGTDTFHGVRLLTMKLTVEAVGYERGTLIYGEHWKGGVNSPAISILPK